MCNKIIKEILKPLHGNSIDRTLFAEQLKGATAQIQKMIDKNIIDFGDQFPAETCKNGYYPLTENVEWTTGFWPGQLWLLWELTNKPHYLESAQKLVRSFGLRIAGHVDIQTHDLGFLYTLSCVTSWELTKCKDARGFALLAADHLLNRYNEKAKIIQAWGNLNDPKEKGRMIIDCNMNLPLLYWATRQTGDERYKKAADAHVHQAAKYLVRQDASTYHTYYMNTETGAPIEGKTQQGYADDSCWSRGQAWGIYGFALNYSQTGEQGFIELSKCLANYFINRLPEDYVCHWDLALLGTEALRDSSSAAITVCGLLELVKILPVTDPDRAYYEEIAFRIMHSLTQNYLTKPNEKSNGLLQHSVYHLSGNKGVDECSSWGDYFYLEALVRFKRSWLPYWSY